MGECCALLICKLHLVLKAQRFPGPLSPRSWTGRCIFGERGGKKNKKFKKSSYKTSSLRLLRLFLRCGIRPRNTAGQPVCLVQSLSLKLTGIEINFYHFRGFLFLSQGKKKILRLRGVCFKISSRIRLVGVFRYQIAIAQ